MEFQYRKVELIGCGKYGSFYKCEEDVAENAYQTVLLKADIIPDGVPISILTKISRQKEMDHPLIFRFVTGSKKKGFSCGA